MRPTLAVAVLTVLLALAGCGGDDGAATDTTARPTVDTTAPPSSAPSSSAVPTTPPTTVRPTTALPTTAAPTTAAPTTAAPTTAAPTTAAPTTVDVGVIVVDADNDPLRTVAVPLGTPVTLTVRSASPQEFHLHGFDLESSGTEVVFAFTADLPGSFELESHDTGTPLLILEVV